MAVRNGDGPVPQEFFPGVAAWGQLAPGSVPSRTPAPDRGAPDSDSGAPGMGTPMNLRDQAVDSRNASPQTPGQNDPSVISPGPAEGYVDSGARSGHEHTDAWPRFSWQASPGGNG